MKTKLVCSFGLCASLFGITIMTIIEAKAKNFGTNGNVHKIVEQPFLEMINERLQKVDMEKEKQKMEEIAKDRIHNPVAIDRITPATEGMIFYHDPTYTLEEDIVLPCGKVLHKAGTNVNPLEHMELNRRLFFIDGKEKKQIKWLKQKLSEFAEDQNTLVENKIILVRGSPLKLEKELKIDSIAMNVYFDQNGELVSRFGINHSPAILEQDGLKLRIKEIKIDE